MKYHFSAHSVRKLLLYIGIWLLILLQVLRSETVIQATQGALILCFKTVIPSLFPFFVLSSLLSGSFAYHLARLCSPIMFPIFRVGGAGALPLIMGIISGYPTGAKITAELYASRLLNQDEAKRLLPFTNNSGPLFIIGAIGTGMLNSPTLGCFLYVIHALCAILVGLCMRFYPSRNSFSQRRQAGTPQPPSVSLSDAITKSVHTMLMVCGFILFFAAVTACLTPLLNACLPSWAVTLVQSAIEITRGASLIIQGEYPMRLTLTLLSFFIGFGGISVMMQVAGILTLYGLPLKTYWMGKLLHGIFSAIFAYAAFPMISDRAVPTMVQNSPNSHLLAESFPAWLSTAAVVICFLLFFKTKRHFKS